MSAIDFTTIPARDKPRKVAIVGYTHSNRGAPYEVDGWEIWGLNNLHRWISDARWDGWVDVHDAKTLDQDPEHLAWLRQRHDFPIWMFAPRDEFPSAVPFPADDLKARFGTYFTNSVSWMVALAITRVEWAIGDGAEIGIYGVDMAVGGGAGSEYGFQRPSCEYFIGVAEGMGIGVTVAPASDLLKCAEVYGETESPMRVKLQDRQAELSERRQAAVTDRDRAIAHARQMDSLIDKIDGAMENNEYFLGAWFTPHQDGSKGRAANDVRAQQED